ncbi:MAG: major capsid protein P2, partial [Lentisphaerae bacterium]|nr:major capsid protein P2 [Lentisphaerota bacterium]
MGTKVYKRMPSFEGVSAGSTATLRCPIGLSYDRLIIEYAGMTLAQMGEIRVVGNGKPFMRFDSGTRLDQLNQFNGRA